MAGTDHSRAGEPPGPPGPVVVLVEPQMGENIGAAARAMWNFGLDRLRLVAPRDGWPNPKAQAMASGAAQYQLSAWDHRFDSRDSTQTLQPESIEDYPAQRGCQHVQGQIQQINAKDND